LNDAEYLLLCEFKEGVEYHTSSKCEADQGDRAYTKMALDEDVSEHMPCRFRSIEGVTPGIIDEVPELGQDWRKYIMNTRR